MTKHAHTFLFLPYAGAAALAAFWLPNFLPDISHVMQLVIAGLVFLIPCLLHHIIRSQIHTRKLAQSLTELSQLLSQTQKNQHKLEDDMLQLRAMLANLASAPQQNVGDVVNEVKVLQKLIEQLYSARNTDIKSDIQPIEAHKAIAKESAAEKPSPHKTTSSRPSLETVPATANTAAGASLPMPPIAYDLAEDEILDALREGLRENGVELALQPIVTLPQRKRRFFECFSRVRTKDGRVLTPEQYIHIAERYGLVTAIDNMQLFRCIQTLRRIRKSNAGIGFFLNISAHTLADRDFFREFINMMAQNAELAPAIVFEFSQRAMEAADDALLHDLGRLSQLGYRFSLDQVTHFDLNPAQLSSHHFRYMKVEAERLVAAARAGALGDDPREFKRMWDSFAIDLIADHVESEPMLLELLDMYLDFGQGYLFGEPRIARAESASLN